MIQINVNWVRWKVFTIWEESTGSSTLLLCLPFADWPSTLSTLLGLSLSVAKHLHVGMMRETQSHPLYPLHSGSVLKHSIKWLKKLHEKIARVTKEKKWKYQLCVMKTIQQIFSWP
uniref:IpaD n=1 Tax=Aster yellows phytoplasma TaxID=35779 RepID=Q847T8_ASTYP|nr:IpaD [Aster yellows phytoplasma]